MTALTQQQKARAYDTLVWIVDNIDPSYIKIHKATHGGRNITIAGWYADHEYIDLASAIMSAKQTAIKFLKTE